MAPRSLWLLPLPLTLALGCGDDADDGGGGAGATSSSGTTTSTGSTGTSAGGGGTGGGGAGGGGAGGGGTGGGESTCTSIETTFAAGLAPTVEIHVATTGSDQTGDGSAGNPYGTIAAAANDLVPGAAIVVHEGTYAGGAFLEDVAGTAEAPIWIGGASGEARPVLQGGANGLHLSGARYVVVHDLEIDGATQNGINCDDKGEYADPETTRFVSFERLWIHDIGTGNHDCLKLSGVNDFWVLESAFARCGGSDAGSGIDHVGCHQGVVAGSSFDDMSGNAVQTKGGSEDIEIRRNVIRLGGLRALNLGGSTGLEFFRPPLSASAPNAEARDIRAVGNVIFGGPDAVAFVGCVGCLAANNTIYQPSGRIVRILQETSSQSGFTFEPASDGVFQNNVVHYDSSAIVSHLNVGAGTDPDSFTFASNLWYASDDPGSSAPNLAGQTETGGIYGEDPGFADADLGDFSIDATSPAAGAGAALPGLYADVDGTCFADPPSVGAHEVE